MAVSTMPGRRRMFSLTNQGCPRRWHMRLAGVVLLAVLGCAAFAVTHVGAEDPIPLPEPPRAVPHEIPPWSTGADGDVATKLRQTVPEIRFDALAFEEVVDFFRDLTDLNIVVNWTAMAVGGVESDKEITLTLSNVTFEKALQ